MIYLNKKRPKKFVIIGAVVLVLIIIVFIVGSASSWGENVFGTVTSPVQGFFNSIGSAVGGFFNNIFSGSKNAEELADLRARVIDLESENNSLREKKAENDRLTELMQIKELHPELEYKAARVIAKTDGSWFDEFTLNIGSSSGIEKDMAVVSGKGLIGRITEVGINWSTVVSVVDGRSAVSVMIERTRDVGVAKGRLTPDMVQRTLDIEYLPSEADIMPGDKVISSGLGGVFPKGLLVGEVVENGKNSDGSILVTVKPVDDFKSLEEVMVVAMKSEPLLVQQAESSPVPAESQ